MKFENSAKHHAIKQNELYLQLSLIYYHVKHTFNLTLLVVYKYVAIVKLQRGSLSHPRNVNKFD